MSTAMAFHRLLVRPATLLLLLVMVFALLAPLIVMEPALENAVYRDFVAGSPSAALLQYSLLLALTAGAATAIILGNASLELQTTDIAWGLPQLGRALVWGIATSLLPGAVLVGMLAARAGTPGIGVDAAAVFIATCAALLVTLDAVQPGALRVAAFVVPAMAFLRPDGYVALVQQRPAFVAAAAIALAILLLRQHVSRRAARRRPVTASQFVGGNRALQLFWGARRAEGPDWTRSLSGAGTSAWIRAAAHELVGGFRGKLEGILAMLVILGAAAYIASPSVLMVATFSLTYNGLQLRGDLGYPLSRADRGRLFYIGSVLDALAVTLIIGSTAMLLHVAGVPRALSEPTSAREYLVMLGACLALTPILQWVRIRGPLPPDAQRNVGGHSLHLVAFMAGSIAVAALTARVDALRDTPAQLIFVSGLIIVSQSLHFLLVRRFFAQADLVRA